MDQGRTWDGLPVAHEQPYACCVVVWRDGEREREFLVLHRLAPGGPRFEGDWAWTPPSGARQPGETPDRAATRELREETGMRVPFERVRDSPTDDVAVHVAKVESDAQVILDGEHDRYAWVSLDEALRRCLPREVGTCLAVVAAALASARAD
ncbi:MAG: NUDIX domain-containing protein [Actinobacteria bacterium]|nr:NUDIX domain-containing protein [Actinomycetota bacterium]